MWKRLAGTTSPLMIGFFLEESLAFVCLLLASGLLSSALCCCCVPVAPLKGVHLEEEEDGLLQPEAVNDGLLSPQ